MGRLWKVVVLLMLLVASPAAARQEELALPLPPVLVAGHWYVPARPMAEWLGADVQWQAASRSLVLAWHGQQHCWRGAAEGLLLRRGRAYVSLRSLSLAFGLDLRRREDLPAFAFGHDETSDLIPIGWRIPQPPRGLTREQRAVWEVLVRPGEKWAVGGMITQPRRIRVVGRWASAMVHPLNVVTDDAMAVLEKRGGQWRLLELSTSVGEDRNYGIPRPIRKRLRLWGS